MYSGAKKNTTFAFVAVDNAGHMVPQDKPEVALDLVTRWLKGKKWA
jgi:cathepsin A (carboxypeptidase C)